MLDIAWVSMVSFEGTNRLQVCMAVLERSMREGGGTWHLRRAGNSSRVKGIGSSYQREVDLGSIGHCNRNHLGLAVADSCKKTVAVEWKDHLPDHRSNTRTQELVGWHCRQELEDEVPDMIER